MLRDWSKQKVTLAVLEDYTFVNTLIEVAAVALVYTEHHRVSQLQAKSGTDTLTRCWG